jgi:Transposase DDE domain
LPPTLLARADEVPHVTRKPPELIFRCYVFDPDRLLGDKGYDSDNIRNDLAERGIEPVIPPRSNPKISIEYDREAYDRVIGLFAAVHVA